MRGFGLLLVLLLLVPTAAAEFGRYDATGYPVNVLGEPTYPGARLPGGVAQDAPPLNVAGPFTVYPYYPILTAEVQRLAGEHPDLVKLHSIGTSTLGLEMWMLEIADFARIESGEGLPLEAREVAWIDGGTHSNEYSGVYFAAHLASFLLDEYESNETARWIVENRHTWIMPLVNPDGSHAFGRLNAKAVNVNRNYPVDWGALAEDPVLNNPGPAPASEVETQHNIAWFNKTQPDLYVSIHCCGNLWLYPYGVEGMDPIDQQTLARVCDEAFADVREDCGPIWSTIYPASGSSVDTVYEYTGAVAFGYEMSGRGAIAIWGQPFTSESVEAQEVESWNGVLHGLLNVHKYGAFPNVTAARVEDGALVVTITNEGYGNLTNASASLLSQTVAIPDLLPGESAQARIEGPLVMGGHDLHLGYTKRAMMAPAGVHAVPLTFVETPDGVALAAIGGEAVGALSVDVPANVPGATFAIAVAVLGIGALLRRR